MAACKLILLGQAGRTKEAAVAAAKVRLRRPGFSLPDLSLPEWNSVDAAHIIEGLRKAGLVEWPRRDVSAGPTGVMRR